MTDGAALHAPATERNREPILAVLRETLPARGTVLEIASGTGEHAVYFARHFPHLIWQPSDIDPAARRSVEAWRSKVGSANLLPPLPIDATADDWGPTQADAIVCINMVHIAPWQAAEGLFRGADRVLPPQGVLFLYGPYHIDGRPTAPSNEAFDLDLRARNPAWGLRTTGEIRGLAARHGWEIVEMVDMPANNTSLVCRRTA